MCPWDTDAIANGKIPPSAKMPNSHDIKKKKFEVQTLKCQN